MEGDGQGLVAIVQSLDPAGVTLTVCNRSRHDPDRRRSPRPRIQLNSVNTRPDMPTADQRSATPAYSAPVDQRFSVETSTGSDFSRQHTSSQICDGRYASSYKLAHCMVTPTSPPEAVSEFPPQRKEPCRNQGNFEIGGHGSGQWNCHGSGHSSGKVRVTSSRVKHLGGSQTWIEKGSSHRYCKSNRETEAFAHSLRKYPSMAPFRTASTDLIEKLIRYTQAKNFQEMSRSTKSMRSLRQHKYSDTHEMAKSSKHQQTYTRRQDDNVANNGNVQVGYKGRTRNFKLYSPLSDSRNLKEKQHRGTTFSSSYDYLKAGNSPYGQYNRSDESPSPVGSSSPERTRSPVGSRSPGGRKSPEVSRSPTRLRSTDRFKSPDRLKRPDRPLRVERPVRDLSLSDMSKYIRSTIRQICNERPVVFQVCPKLKNRLNQHRKVCPNKSERSCDVMDDEPEEDQASGSVLSRLIQSFSGSAPPSTEQTGCQCTRTDCYCTKATQCVNNPDASTNTTACSCSEAPTKRGCCRGMPCICANKAQDQVYYNKRIDEEISEWLKDVPVHSIECSDGKKKIETAIKELRKTLKQLPDDENFDDNARNEIKNFVDDFPVWNPGKDKTDEDLFKDQLADKLTELIIGIPRKPDRFRDIVKKWIVNMDFEDDGEDIDKETIIDKIVNKLKTLAAERPVCDIKYKYTLRKEIIELLVELALKFNGDMVILKKMANQLAAEIVSIPRNVNLSGNTTDLSEEFEENVSDWICEHGLCGELKKNPKLIEGLAKKLNKLKSQGIDDENVVGKMKEEIHKFVDDIGIAIETMDELIDELMKQLSNTVQTDEMERQDENEITKLFTDWLSNLPSASDLHLRKFEKNIKELVKLVQENKALGNEELKEVILNYLVNADLFKGPTDLGVHVEKLLEKLNLFPSYQYHREQVQQAIVKDILDIIENMPIPENKKEELRNKALRIVENHLQSSVLNSEEAHDEMKETIMEDMNDVISTINLPKETQLKLKASLRNILTSNFDKSLTRLRRLSRDESNLKQIIAKDVRKAVKELPIDTDKKKHLMQQVKGTLSKNMHKPLPSNVKTTINDEISDIVERCPISEDHSIVGSLKKMLSAVASKNLNICVPKCVCDIQEKVEEDVGIVIDRSSIDIGKKKELKKSIQDILTENEDRRLSDEVLRTIKKDISGVVSDLSIPQDKKDVLKNAVGETLSKDFNEALSSLKHDLNKIRNKLFEDICNAIEKSPIPRDVKTHLINKLKAVLARNLDSSLSDKEKYTILDDVSNIVKDDMPEEKRKSLTNKLSKKLDTQQKNGDINNIDQLTENLKELENKILEYIFREMEQAVEEAPIPGAKNIELKNKLKDITTIDYKNTAEDIAEALTDGMNEILDELNLPKDRKNELKSDLTAAIDEYSKLLRETKDVAEYDDKAEYLPSKRRSSANKNVKYKIIEKGLDPIKEFDNNKTKESILQGIEKIIDESTIPEDKKTVCRKKLKKMAADYFEKPLSDEVLDAIKIGISDILDELEIPSSEEERALVNMANENVANLPEVDKTKAKENILQGIEDITRESPIPEEKKTELKRKLKKLITDNLEKPFSEDGRDAITLGISDILDELQIPKAEKKNLKRALMSLADDNLDNLREAKQVRPLKGQMPEEEVDKTKATERILQGIEEIIEESAMPEEKKVALKQKLKKMAADNLKKPFSEDVQDDIKIGMGDILDKLQVPKAEKNKLKRALINMVDDNLREAKQVRPLKGQMLKEQFDDNITKESILQGIEKIIDESTIPEDKKTESRRKLKKMAADYFEKPLSDEVLNAIKIGISDILDELEIPSSEKKRVLVNMANENVANLPEVDKTKAKENILQGIKDITRESPISEEKKSELKRKLKKLVTDNLEKPFSEDGRDAITLGISDILDELQIPKAEKKNLKRALMSLADDNLDNLRETKQVRPLKGQMPEEEEVDKTKAKESILQGIEEIIEESAMPEEKKLELKQKLKKMAANNFKKPFSEDVQDDIKIGMGDILDKLQVPTAEKYKLKRALMNMVDDNFREAKQAKPLKNQMPVAEVDTTKAKERILQDIDKITGEASIPEEKKLELKGKLKKLVTVNLEKPFSEDVQDAIKLGISGILDELQIPKSEKKKLKRVLLNMADDNLDNLRDEKQVRSVKGQMPEVEVDKTKAKDNIVQGIEEIIEESAIPEQKKGELKQKLKKIAADNLKKPFSEEMPDDMKIGMGDILNELQVPKAEKNKLKRALMNMVDDNFREATLAKPLKGQMPVGEVDITKAKKGILQGIENIIVDAAIPGEKKIELKQKLKKMAADNLKKPFSEDVKDAIEIDIGDVLDELQVPKAEKNKLKRALINMVDDNLREAKQVRSVKGEMPEEEIDTTKAKDSIVQGIAETIEESAMPEEKKVELKQKFKKMAADNLRKPFSKDVQDVIKTGIGDILDEIQVPKAEKNKLKRALTNVGDDNLREPKQANPLKGQMPVGEIDTTKAKEIILRDIDKITGEASIPEEKKLELKRKLKKMANDNLKKPLSENVPDAIKIGIGDVLDEVQVPKAEKNKLKRALTNMVDDNLREAKQVRPFNGQMPEEEIDKTKAKGGIVQGIEEIIEESAMPEEKKVELTQKLKKMAADNLKKPFSEDVQDDMKIGMGDILDELQVPKAEKNKLKRALTKMVDDNLREAKQAKLLKSQMPVGEVDTTKAKKGILQGIERIIVDAAIPEEKKLELKRKLKKMADDNLKKPLSEYVPDAIKIGISDVLDEVQVPKAEKNKLKRALTNMVDDNLRETTQAKPLKGQMPVGEVDTTKAKKSIVQGIEEIIEESAMPEEKKVELKQKLKKMAADNFKKPFSEDVQDDMKIGMGDILDKLQVPKAEKNKLKRALLNMVDDNLREAKQVRPFKGQMPEEEIDKTKAKDSIVQGIEEIIEESAMPEEKKVELTQKLKKIAADNLKKPFSEDVQDDMKIGMGDILDELQVPKAEKNKLKRALLNMVDDNLREAKQVRPFKGQMPEEEIDKTKAKDSIVQGIEEIIEESAMPEEKKVELKQKLKKMAANNLKKPFSEDVQDDMKIGIGDVLDEVQVPKAEKNKLKRALTNMVDDNLREAKQVRPFRGQMPEEEIDKTKAKDSIVQGIEDIIEESAMPEQKKVELKQKLKKMAANNLKRPFSEDVQDDMKIGMGDILDELQVPKAEKNKLKRALTKMVDDNLREAKQAKPLKNLMPVGEVDITKAKDSIVQGIEEIIEGSAMPEEKKVELKQKLKKMAANHLKKPFSEDVQDDIKIGMGDILDELQVPKAEKNKLKRALTNMVDDNLQEAKQAKPLKCQMPVGEVDTTKAKKGILQGIERIIVDAAIPEEKKLELKRKLKKMADDNLKKPLSEYVPDAIKIGISDVLDEVQVPKAEKNKLKRALTNMVDDNLRETTQAKPLKGQMPVGEVDTTKAKKSILQGIEEIIEESAMPEEKKVELKQKLKKMAADNLKKPFSEDVQDDMKIGIGDILDELQVPKAEKNKLKRALTNMVDDNLREVKQAKPFKGQMPVGEADTTKAKENILRGINKITGEASIPEDKKFELKRKLKKMADDNLKKPLSADVPHAIKIGIGDILDELQVPKAEKNKLKRALINMVDDNFVNLRKTLQVRPLEGQMPAQKVDATNAKESILQGIERLVADAAIPEDKKLELKQKLKKMAAGSLKKLVSDDLQDAMKIGIGDILDELKVPKSEKNKLKSALINMVDENLTNLRNETPKLSKRVNDRIKLSPSQKKILVGLEKAIDEAPIIIAKKEELIKKLEDIAIKNLQTSDSDISSSDDFEESLKDGINEFMNELNSPKSTKSPYAKRKSDASDPKMKRTKSPQTKRSMVDDGNLTDTIQDKYFNGLMPIEEADETNVKENILQGNENIIEKSAIPENKKMELKKKLKKLTADNFRKPITEDMHDAMKIDIRDILDDLQIPVSEKKILKRALFNMLDENVDKLRGLPPELQSQADHFNALEQETQNNVLDGFEKTIDEAPIPLDKKKELKKKIKDLANKNFQKPLSDDTAEALKDGIHEILDELNLPKDKENILKNELTAAVDDNFNNLNNEINLAKSTPDAKRNKLNFIIRSVLPQFDEAVDPSYQKQLAEEFDELLDIALTDGNFKDARKKLIKKLMRDQNLSEKEASAPVDEMIDRAREMALKDDMGDEKHELDSSYVKTLEPDIDELVRISLVDGDLENARRKLTKKLMREQNLPEEEASGFTDELVSKAQKLALTALSKDKSLHKKAIAIAISDAVDQSTLSKADKSSLKNKLLNKMEEIVDESPHINDAGALKNEVLKGCQNLVDSSSIPISKKSELKLLLKDEIVDDDGEDDDDGGDKISKLKEAFSKNINDAVDLSTLSKLDKSSLKQELLNEMEETVEESPHINDTGALKAEVLKGCQNLVAASSIPPSKKSEMKSLLKEEIMDDYDDDESSEYEDKITSYKDLFAKATDEAVYETSSDEMDDHNESPRENKLKKYKDSFTKAINHAVDQSTIPKTDKNSQNNKLLSKLNETIDNSPHQNDIVSLIDEILKDSKKVVDSSSIPNNKKNELKLLLQEAIVDASKELMDDEEVSQEAFAMFKDKIAECVKTWMDSLPIDLDPKDTAAVAKDLASDIVDRQKYLQVHPEAVSTDKDELDNLKYQIFRRMKNLVDPEDMPPIMEGAEKLYRMIMDIEPPPGCPKLRRAQITPESRRTDPVLQDEKKSPSTTLSTGNIHCSLKELIETSKNIRKQWSKNLEEAVSKLPLPRNEKWFLKEKLAIYDETGQDNMLSTNRKDKKASSTAQGSKPKKHVADKPAHVPPKSANDAPKSAQDTPKSAQDTPKSAQDTPKPAQDTPKSAHVAPKSATGSPKSATGSPKSAIGSPKSASGSPKLATGSPKSANGSPKPARVASPKPLLKNNKGKPLTRLSKIEKALTINTNTTKQKSPFTPKSNEGVDEKDFKNFVMNTIRAWLASLQVQLDLNNKIREELANDIVNMKKYILVFGSEEPSPSNALEYLKLQVYRRLNEFVPTGTLKTIILNTKILLEKINTVQMKVTPESSRAQRSEKTGKKLGIADILDNNAKATDKELEKEQELINMEFSPVQTSTPEKNASQTEEPTLEEYKAKVADTIKTWVETTSINLKPETKTEFIDELANDILDRKKYLQVHPERMISKKDEIENLRFQVFKRLIKADPDASVTPDVEEVEELYKLIGGKKSLTPKQAEEFKTALNEEISAILDDYNICCDRRELHPTIANELTKLGKVNADQDDIVENLIDAIKRLTYLSPCVCDEEAEELAHKLLYRTKKLIAKIQERDRLNAEFAPVKKKDFKEAVMKDIGDVFNDRPMSEEKRKVMEGQLAEEYAKDLGIPLEDSDVTLSHEDTGRDSKKEGYGMSFNGLTNFIDTWLSSINADDDTKDEDEIKDMKKDMAYSLIHKIGEMNVDPEIFNDDSLYEAVLRDELHNLLSDVTLPDDEIEALKEDLIEKVLEAQHRAHDEIAGQTYKRNLRDTISKFLPDQQNLSKEEQATMEILKDQLADAYIDLHYSGDNENQRERLKRKISEEINNFCKDYLYRNPCSPLNSKTLNKNLYSALNKVPLPAGDSMRYEVELARIRQEINDWIKELPLPPQNPTEVLARNRMVYVLAKKLFDIEVEGDDTENESMRKEIVKFLNKMPLKSTENNDTLADNLIDKLKASEQSRKYDASANVTIDAFGNVSAAGSGMDGSICPAYAPLATPGPSGTAKVCRRPCPYKPKPFPPCTLSPEDRAHLERIKRRTCLSPSCLSTFLRKQMRDTGVGSRPVDAGSQTVLRPCGMDKFQSSICPVDNEQTPRPCPGLSANLAHPSSSNARRDPFEIEKPPPPRSPICPATHENTPRPCPGSSRLSPQSGPQMRRHTLSSSNVECPVGEVQPQIIIKQYYWNPSEKNSAIESNVQQSARPSRHQSDQSGQTGSAPCGQTRTSSYTQSFPAPCHRPSLGKLQQQNASPQKVSYDQSFTCPEPKTQHQPSPERYSCWDPQSSFQRPSQEMPSARSSCTPSPCMSPFGLNQQFSPPASPSFSKRDHECRMPKRDGLQDQTPCSSRPCRKERVIELGSLDDMPDARPKKRHNEQSDWPYTKLQEDDNFWGVPMRRVILDEGIDESVVMEREQREERIRCRCKERLIPKSGGRSHPRTCPSQEITQVNEDEQNLKKCSKCCGRHCPYPSFLYFRE